MQTIVGTGNGTYGAASLGTDAMAMISGVPSMMGQADKFGLNPSNDMLTFIPASNKQVNADLVINDAGGCAARSELSRGRHRRGARRCSSSWGRSAITSSFKTRAAQACSRST